MRARGTGSVTRVVAATLAMAAVAAIPVVWRVAEPLLAPHLYRQPPLLEPRHTYLGKGEAGIMPETAVASPDSKRIAYVAEHNGKEFLVTDGRLGDGYDEVMSGTPKERPIWSPTSDCAAYYARQGAKWRVMAGSAAGKEFDRITRGSFTWSPNGDHFAYVAESGGKQFVVADAAIGEPFDEITYGPVCATGRQRFVYIGRRADGYHVATGTSIQKAYERIRPRVFMCHYDSVLYAAERGTSELMVVGSYEGPEFDAVADPVISRNGKHVAYVEQTGLKARAVLDGVPGAPYDAVGSAGLLGNSWNIPGYRSKNDAGGISGIIMQASRGYLRPGCGMAFSPDGEHLAYAARNKSAWVMVTDRVEGRRYSRIPGGGPLFSSTGRMAYVAWRRAKAVIVVDDKEAGSYDNAVWDSFMWSPNGKTWACVVKSGGKWRVAINGAETAGWREIQPYSLTLSPSGRRVAYIAASGPIWPWRRWTVVVDGVAGPRADAVVPGSMTWSDDGRHIAYGVRQGIWTRMVLDGVPGPRYQWVDKPVFGPDGRHMAYTAGHQGRKVLVVDGYQSPKYDARNLGSKVVFDGPAKVHTLVADRGDFIVVEADARGK